MTQTVVVIGAGAFGTALASVFAENSQGSVTLLGRDASRMADLAATRKHDHALPGIPLSRHLAFSADPACLALADVVLLSVPSRDQLTAARIYGPMLSPTAQLVSCAKGLDRESLRLITEVLEEVLPGRPISALSGPGFAADIAKGLPTAMVLAGPDLSSAAALAHRLSGPSFRLYPSEDRIGVQLGGALKNVLAIACGIVEGAGLGDSARAALIARGLAEMSRLVLALKGQAETVRGLSGLGDLVLTATSHQSRNLRYGIELGRFGTASHADGQLVEGAFAASVAARLAESHGLDLPITDAVSAIISGQISVPDAIERLMTRPITTE